MVSGSKSLLCLSSGDRTLVQGREGGREGGRKKEGEGEREGGRRRKGRREKGKEGYRITSMPLCIVN